jgi:hypothetical protein
MIDKESLDIAYDAAIAERKRFWAATENYEKAKLIYEQKYSLAIYNDQIEGKNVAQRDAHALVLLESVVFQRDKAATELREVKLDYDLAMLELGRVKALLRLMEVEASFAEIAAA